MEKELELNWNEIAEELMERLRNRPDYRRETFWLDSLSSRDFLAEHLREMFQKFFEAWSTQ